LASPSGLEGERKAFRDAVDEFNQVDGRHRGVQFMLVGWEDTLATAGRPQDLIHQPLLREAPLSTKRHWSPSPLANPGRE